jgi:hypothetical protein
MGWTLARGCGAGKGCFLSLAGRRALEKRADSGCEKLAYALVMIGEI